VEGNFGHILGFHTVLWLYYNIYVHFLNLSSVHCTEVLLQQKYGRKRKWVEWLEFNTVHNSLCGLNELSLGDQGC